MWRYMANIVRIWNKKDRTTMSWSRYIYMSFYWQISDWLSVDHIDWNKLNDDISNLQLLSISDNNKKCIIEQGRSAIKIEKECPICNTKYFIRKWQSKNTCSPECWRINYKNKK